MRQALASSDQPAPPAGAAPVDPTAEARATAKAAGLIYASDKQPGYRRQRRGKGFTYFDSDAKRITDGDEIARHNKLAVPPAWTEVWLCPSPHGHIQATGRDARDRKQYRYHEQWRSTRDADKFEHMLDFATNLPALRERVLGDLRCHGLPREKVLATIVYLLENTMARVGNQEYARNNKSYGLTTLRDRHVAIRGSTLRFEFMGKSGKAWKVRLSDRRVARIVRECQDIPGRHLFQYIDEAGERQKVNSADLNAYLREISGDDITAKDFRNWAGIVLAALALKEVQEFDSEAAAKRNLRAAIEKVAAQLGNTPTICRKCYIHPGIMDCYLEGSLIDLLQRRIGSKLKAELVRLKPEEAAVLALLRARLGKEMARRKAG